jgi:hypothetical protein
VQAGPDKAVPWTKPEDLPFDPENPLAALGNVSPRGFLAGFFDGHVVQLKVDNRTLKALITPDGGEPIDVEPSRGQTLTANWKKTEYEQSRGKNGVRPPL